MSENAAFPAQPFEIVSIEPANPPHGSAGKNWHRYVIVQGTNTIQGYRQGSLRAVTRAVKEIVVQLNERRNGKVGRVPLMTTRKPAPDK